MQKLSRKAIDMFDTAEQRRHALYGALSQVPEGKVVTYGQLAKLAGLGRAARWVGSQLKKLPEGTNLPWHRVLNHTGRLSVPEGSEVWIEQIQRLRAEGVNVVGGRVSLRLYKWHAFDGMSI